MVYVYIYYPFYLLIYKVSSQTKGHSISYHFMSVLIVVFSILCFLTFIFILNL